MSTLRVILDDNSSEVLWDLFELSVTPPGHSDESAELAEAEQHNIDEYLEVPATLNVERLAEALRQVLRGSHNRLSHEKYSKLSSRLAVLLDPDEILRSAESPKLDSFKGMMNFLSQNAQLRMPSIFVNAVGLFDASWRASREQLVSLVFHDTNSVSWLLFIPWPDDDEGTEEASGRCSIDRVTDRIKDYGVLSWMEET